MELMSVYDKIIYYCGIAGLAIILGFIIAMLVGAVDANPSAVGKIVVGCVVGIGLFARGYRARQQAKQREAQEILNSLFDQSDKGDKVNSG